MKGLNFKRILVFLVALFVSLGTVGTMLNGLSVSSKSTIPEELNGLKILESKNIAFGFDVNTGLGKVYDKRTKQIWSQCYATAPIETEIPVVDFSDSGCWRITGGTTKKSKSETKKNTVLFALNEEFTNGTVDSILPGSKIIKGHYRLELTYTADNASGFAFDMSVGFRSNHYDYEDNFQNYLFGKNMEYVSQGVENGKKTISLDIPESVFKEHTAFAAPKVTVMSYGNASGNVYIERIALYSIGSMQSPVIIRNAVCSEEKIGFSVNSEFRANSGKHGFTASISFEDDDTLVYKIENENNDDPFAERLLYPGTFVNDSETLKWALPNNSGAYLSPYDLESDINKKLYLGEFYYNTGLSMAFIGADDGDNGGYLEIIDNPVCALSIYPLSNINGKAGYLPAVSFEGDKNMWAENRQVRFRFVTDGNYVNLAKEYRKIASEKGFLVTYKEKAESNPTVLKSTGAHRVDLGIDIRSIPDFFKKMKEAGITNIMTKVSGPRDGNNNNAVLGQQDVVDSGLFVLLQQEYPEYLLYDYEFARESVTNDYPDIVRPNGYTEFANDWISVDGKGRQRLWYPYSDHTEWQARVLCPCDFKSYIDFYYKLFPKEIYPVKSRMYDTLCTSTFGEGQCSDPNHPCDKLTSYFIQREAMKYLNTEYGIEAHTEGNGEYLVPYVNSFEGSIDLLGLQGYGYLLIQGREMSAKCPNEAEKIPLWQLVFHDCGATYWHWEYGELDLGKLNDYCDMYTMLYGEHGMFLPKYNKTHIFSKYFDTMIERIKRLNLVTEEVCYDEMLSHEFLTADGKVQRTDFSSGLEVTVNLSYDKSYTIDGKELSPLDYRINRVSVKTSTVIVISIVAIVSVIVVAGVIIIIVNSKKRNSVK